MESCAGKRSGFRSRLKGRMYMRKLLVTGGTVFVSRFIAEYFVQKGDAVYVLNRNRHPQPERTKLIEADRHHLGTILRQQSFDAVLDVTAYTREDVSDLLDGMDIIHWSIKVGRTQDIRIRYPFLKLLLRCHLVDAI